MKLKFATFMMLGLIPTLAIAGNCPSGTVIPTLSFSPDPVFAAPGGSKVAITVSASPASQAGVTYKFTIQEAAVKCGNSSIGTTSGVTGCKPDSGQSGSDQIVVRLQVLQGGSECKIGGSNARRSITIPVTIGTPTPPQAPSGAGGTASMDVTTGNIAGIGAVVLDNTPNPGTPGIMSNMQTKVGGARYLNNTNNISYDGLQVMQRQTDNDLWDEIGVTNTNSVGSSLFATARQTKYFVNGQPVLDLDRFRTAADWLRANVSPSSTHPAGTYGTISWMEFVRNVANDIPMYGIVRVLVPLRLKHGGRHDADHDGHDDNENDSELNAMKLNVPSNQIYSFCTQSEHDGDANKDVHEEDGGDGRNLAGHNASPPSVTGCGNAPIAGIEFEFPELPKVYTANGYTFTNHSRIRVYGTLFMDFVNAETDTINATPGTPILPQNLPFHPRDILIETAVPFLVNPALDSNGDNVMDNLSYIDSLSKNISCTATPCTWKYPNPQNWDFAKVDQSMKDRYQYQTGVTLTSTVYNSLNTASKYHLLMPSGYETGWHTALTELGVTAPQWVALGFEVPPAAVSAGRVPTEADIRSPYWEDFPCYISTGGLFSMRGHVNFSGLLYIPQAIELMQTYFNSARQYIMGGVIVRDGFYIEGIHSDPTLRGISVITSDPNVFAQVKINPAAVQTASTFKSASTVIKDLSNPVYAEGANSGGADTCVGCSGTTGAAKPQTKGNTFVIIRP